MAKKRPMGRPKKLTTILQPNGNIKKNQMMEFQRDWQGVNGKIHQFVSIRFVVTNHASNQKIPW